MWNLHCHKRSKEQKCPSQRKEVSFEQILIGLHKNWTIFDRKVNFVDIHRLGPWTKNNWEWKSGAIAGNIEEESSNTTTMSPWLSHNHSARLSVADDTEDVENWTESERNSISGWCIEDQPSETTASLISFVSCLFRSWQTLTTLNLQWNRTWATGARYLADALEINQVNYDLLLFNIDWIIRLFLDTHRSRSCHHQHRSWRCSASDWGIENQPSKTELHFTSMLDSFSSKTLSTLGLSKNDIRNEGAQYLADALKINEVREDRFPLTIDLQILVRHWKHWNFGRTRSTTPESRFLLRRWKSIE